MFNGVHWAYKRFVGLLPRVHKGSGCYHEGYSQPRLLGDLESRKAPEISSCFQEGYRVWGWVLMLFGVIRLNAYRLGAGLGFFRWALVMDRSSSIHNRDTYC